MEGITANVDVCRNYVEHSIGVVTALNPLLGYDKTTELAAEAMKTGKGIVQLVTREEAAHRRADFKRAQSESHGGSRQQVEEITP